MRAVLREKPIDLNCVFIRGERFKVNNLRFRFRELLQEKSKVRRKKITINTGAVIYEIKHGKTIAGGK